MDREQMEAVPVERRHDETRRLVYLRKLNIGLAFSAIAAVASMFAAIAFMWEMTTQKNLQHYMNCVELAAIGVEERSCKPYDAYIELHTNAFRRWEKRLNETTEQQIQREASPNKEK
jgi:hypothetical protein